jgi:putative Mg2+ transporter-C (MgtC) family protein
MLEIDITIKLFVAVVFGGTIGILREIEGKTAGLRTHILVTVGSTLIMIIAVFLGNQYPVSDPSRMAAGLITGIGFLGGGAILKDSGGIKGLTTAASIWVCSAIGMAVGCSYFSAATITTIFSLLIIWGLFWVEKYILKTR